MLDEAASRPDGESTEEQIAAAQLRLVLDRKLGHDTPDYVRRMAGESRSYRTAARRNRRINTTLQASALTGSIIAASLAGAGAGDSTLLQVAAVTMTLTAAILGLLIYFKFKDRAMNLARTADDLDPDAASAG
ncbi:SLATT domain-containing protein [Amycolatopsis sp. NPDC006131]|uniref:SLATT domain-containing protein n=1 Tax=Amycolatopsis sp. NPDC006131 TaxID=3156731 RepID=UPI0033B290E5